MNVRRAVSIIAAIAALALGRPAAAITVTYDFWLNAPNGYPVTDLVLYGANATQDEVYLAPITLQPSGAFRLTQTLGFQPTRALVLGITERDKDDWWDIVVFTNPQYAASNLGKRYSEMFSSANPGYLGHNVVSVKMQEAHAGDLASLAELTAFLRGPDAAAAYFDPYGSFSIIQFTGISPPIGGTVPAPASLALIGIGRAALGAATRLRAN